MFESKEELEKEFKVKLTKEDLIDIRNCLIYHIMQHQRIRDEQPVLTIKLPSMYKSVAHYQRLFKKIKEVDSKKK